MLNDMDFYHLQENIKKNNSTHDQILKKLLPKYFLEAGEFLGNKIADAVTKLNDNKIIKKESVEEVIIPLEKRDKILNGFR